jgi:transposase
MPAPLTFTLTSEQQHELEAIRDRHAQAYVRERAAALLKIAGGQSAHHVARTGLLKPRDPDSVYGWLRRYQAEGVSGLLIRPGRGRKRKYFPPQP